MVNDQDSDVSLKVKVSFDWLLVALDRSVELLVQTKPHALSFGDAQRLRELANVVERQVEKIDTSPAESEPG